MVDAGWLKTSIFISDPHGAASLVRLLAGLAGFFWLDLSYFTVYSTKGFSAVLWGKQVIIIIYQSTRFMERCSSSNLAGDTLSGEQLASALLGALRFPAAVLSSRCPRVL